MQLTKHDLDPKQREAFDAIVDTSTSQSIFLSGDAGTGKSTVLRLAAEELIKNNITPIVMAPTGIAAENVDIDKAPSSTIHKFLHIAPATNLFGKPQKQSIAQFKNIIKHKSVIIIDEISMQYD